MIQRKLNNENTINIVGVLTDVDSKTGVSQKGTEYITGKVTVKSGEDHTYTLHFYSNKLTKEGVQSKLYNTYSTIQNYIGRKVRITGQIREAKITAGSEIRYGNSLDLRFINFLENGDATPEEATFSISGYIVGGLRDVYESDGETVRTHLITVGQANYSNTEAVHIRLNVSPKNVAAVDKIRSDFTDGTSVNFSGTLNFYVVNDTITEENDFGGSTKRVVQRSIKEYNVERGRIFHEDSMVYTPEEIKELEDAYKLEEKQLLEKNTNGGLAQPVANNSIPRTAATPHLI